MAQISRRPWVARRGGLGKAGRALVGDLLAVVRWTGEFRRRIGEATSVVDEHARATGPTKAESACEGMRDRIVARHRRRQSRE